ncbi:MAG: DUF429 domain-containing protein [Anaerolineales bacterium]|jgi:hypothetical protein
MLFTDTSFIGIDPTAGVKPFVYAAIDKDRELLALGQGLIDDVLAFAAGQRQAIVAVCAPRRPNTGVMRREAIRQDLDPVPHPGRWVDFRLAEYQLSQRNIRIPQTRKREVDCPKWMRMGFSLYKGLENFGYQDYPETKAQCQLMEVYPHASFSVLLGVLPFPKNTLEGRMQRQLILFKKGIHLPDPMDYFKEITRSRLLSGDLPQGDLYSPCELDALVAAYSAWYGYTNPDRVTLCGDPEEGQIVVPAKKIKIHYS